MTSKTKKWLFFGSIFALGFTLSAFGVTVREAKAAYVLIVCILGLVGGLFALADKLVVAHQTANPPSNPKCGYRAIIARDKNGQMTDGWIMGLVREGTKGYIPQPDYGIFADYEVAQKRADQLNAATGLSRMQVNRLVNRWITSS